MNDDFSEKVTQMISKFPRGSARSLRATFLPDAVGIWIAGAAWYRSATEITPHNPSITMWDIVFGGKPVSRPDDGHEML